jgi:hypothetical protein
VSLETKAIPSLLDLLTIKDSIVTIDAMGCQKEIAEKLIKKDGDYIFGLKGNQANLQEEVISYFDSINEDSFKIKALNNPLSYYKTVDGEHGRIETRECFVSTNLDLISSRHILISSSLIY